MAAKKIQSKSKSAPKDPKKSAHNRTIAPSSGVKAPRRENLSLLTFSPSLTVNDVEASLAWYRDVLGFKVKERWEEGVRLVGVEMAAGKVAIMLGQDDWKKGRKRVKGQGIRMYCITGQDVDRLAARIKAQGGVLTQEPKDQRWGMRDIAIDDPDGYKITIAAALKTKR